MFTSRGGTLTNLTSEVEIEVPKGAVAPGKRQKLWFEVIQKVHDPAEENKEISIHELSQNELSGSDSSVDEVGNSQSERRRRTIQLSTMVLIGPSDAKFDQPIKIKMPHCLPYRNNSWHLHLQARAQNCESDNWLELSNSSGLIIPQSQQRQRYFKVHPQHTSYQLIHVYANVGFSCDVHFPVELYLPDALALCCGEDARDGLLQAVWKPHKKRLPHGQEDGGLHFCKAGQREDVVCSRDSQQRHS